MHETPEQFVTGYKYVRCVCLVLEPNQQRLGLFE